MLKKFLSILLAGTSLSIFNPQIALAERARPFLRAETFYPDVCTIALEGEVYYCNYLVMGFFSDGNGNIQFCDYRSNCFILIMDVNAAEKIVNDQSFSITDLAWQRNNKIVNRFEGYLDCAASTEGIGCIGTLSDGKSIAIYTK
ncbi:hypothetical protein H6F32_17745 [Anabaena sp. FACHB-1237]|uniref:hypothetical protein n=1 Tax=Anabaena sp. FACHB-1237 TaxID=2692769 RepID=UPI00168002A9|nr:hypothetical protein [Anabaena sp. FACHB-1237]MBD2139364.1 hypothetical protein [Anabaena sp. FACHB-1237]